MSAVLPAVLLSQLPDSLCRQGEQQATVSILGRCGRGAVWWRQDQVDKSNFVVVFLTEEDRARWQAESLVLKELLKLDVQAELRTFDRHSNWLVENEKTPAGPYKLKLSLGSLGRIEVALNKSGLLEVVEVERLAGRKVLAIKFKKVRGKGWRTLKIEKGQVEAPYYGWGERVYIVDLDYGPVGGGTNQPNTRHRGLTGGSVRNQRQFSRLKTCSRDSGPTLREREELSTGRAPSPLTHTSSSSALNTFSVSRLCCNSLK